MPARDTSPIGAPCWVDLMTSDVEASRAFYGDLLGWHAGEPNDEYGGYFQFDKGGAPVAGGMPRMPEVPDDVPDGWSIHLATADATKTVELAEANGGSVMVPPMPIGDLGTMSMVADPGGAAIGAWQPDTFPGIALEGETGAPSWFELLTRGYDTAVAFYRDVFGWTTHVVSDESGFRYTVQLVDDVWHAGIMDASSFLPEGVPSHWSVYFGVDDADAALVRVAELGGAVVMPAEDTPYGRLATVTDPTGAMFKLVAPNEAMPAKS